MANDVVFVHGWGLNSGVWNDFQAHLKSLMPSVCCHNIDLPGYGESVEKPNTGSLIGLAEHCLDEAPASAVWVGWSLGGLVSLQAALMQGDSERITALQLINTSPKFTQSPDWPIGVNIDVFRRFSDELANDYESALKRFLLLQSGASKGARELARRAHHAICASPFPARKTLQEGINCLEKSDLRAAIESGRQLAGLPVQVVVGELDRVTPPASSQALAKSLQADVCALRAGHAPFLTHVDESVAALQALCERAL